MFIRNIFATDIGFAMTIAALLCTVILNNIVTHPKTGVHYNLTVGLPRWIFGVMLLTTSKDLKHRVPLFTFISQCSAIILFISLCVLSVAEIPISATENSDVIFYRTVFYTQLFLTALTSIDSAVYDKRHKNDI